MSRVAIVGGGLSGLAAAYALSRRAAEPWRASGAAPDVVLIERAARFGGKIHTARRDGLIIERGPDSFLARKPAIRALIHALGLTDMLAAVGPEGRGSYIWHAGRLHAIPEGLSAGIPTRLRPLFATSLLTPRGKLRAALDLVISRGPEGDESLGAFLERRFGHEVRRRIAEPLLAGIYAGDVDRLSLMATFPQFKNLERAHRSLLLAMFRARRAHPAASTSPRHGASAPDPKTHLPFAGGAEALPPWPEAVRGSTFLSLKGGLADLVEALEKALEEGGTQLVRGVGVQSVRRDGEVYRLILDDGATIDADALILAVPPTEARRLFGAGGAPFDALAASTAYASVANVALWFDERVMHRLPPGSGFVVARGEGRRIAACTWTTRKWPHTTPPGQALFRLYIGGAGDDTAERLDDESLIALARAELQATLGIAEAPVGALPTRWLGAMPQYAVGHLDRLKALRKALAETLPGVFVAGSAYDGVGLPDVAESGRRAAEAVQRYMESVKGGQTLSIHIGAKPGEIAPNILLPGDPLRAKMIAETFLEDVREYNRVRNMLGFTGTYKGVPVSVQGTGMGVPSISIYVHELLESYGVRRMIRVGTCGAMQPEIRLRDVILAIGAATDSNVNRLRFFGLDYAPTADFALLQAAHAAAEAVGIRVHVGNVFTTDSFYADDERPVAALRAYGTLAVEMETAALYTIAHKFRAQALSVLTVSDHLVTREVTSAEEREKTFREMIEIALEALVRRQANDA